MNQCKQVYFCNVAVTCNTSVSATDTPRTCWWRHGTTVTPVYAWKLSSAKRRTVYLFIYSKSRRAPETDQLGLCLLVTGDSCCVWSPSVNVNQRQPANRKRRLAAVGWAQMKQTALTLPGWTNVMDFSRQRTDSYLPRFVDKLSTLRYRLIIAANSSRNAFY